MGGGQVITERLMAAGDWDIDLDPATPYHVTDALTFFGTVFVTPVWMPQHATDITALKAAALYAGVLTGLTERNTRLEGYGLAWMLGNQDGLSDIAETTATTSAATFADRINTSVLTQTGDKLNGISSGSFDAGVATNDIVITAGQSRLDVLRTTCRVFDKDWRINPDGTLDADDTTTLFNGTPTVILNPWWGGRDTAINGFLADLEVSEDVEDYTTRWVVKPNTGSNGEDDITTTYYGLDGVLIIRERYTQGGSSIEDQTDANTVAARWLAKYDQTQREVSAEIPNAYAVRRDIQPGDYVYIYDPELGLVDTNEVYYRGQRMRPVALQCKAITWPVQAGMGVFHRASDSGGTITDLTPWVLASNNPTRLEIGASPRKVAASVFATNLGAA